MIIPRHVLSLPGVFRAKNNMQQQDWWARFLTTHCYLMGAERYLKLAAEDFPQCRRNPHKQNIGKGRKGKGCDIPVSQGQHKCLMRTNLEKYLWFNLSAASKYWTKWCYANSVLFLGPVLWEQDVGWISFSITNGIFHLLAKSLSGMYTSKLYESTKTTTTTTCSLDVANGSHKMFLLNLQ